MDELETIDVCVVGGGVIGLAIARELARAGREVVVLEAEPSLGSHTSSRNSEVIHAGIYYPTGSLKASLCVAGNRALYDYCEGAGVGHSRLGKLIVAVHDDEVPVLEAIKRQAEANGVESLSWLDTAEIRALEPNIVASRGLWSPSSGIVDSHEFMSALRRDAEAAGARIVLSTPALAARATSRSIELSVGGAEPISVSCNSLVNAAGLRAQEFATRIAGLAAHHVPACHYAKGHYFVLAGRAPFSHLVYPVPVPGGLGIHVTLDLAGQARFGPDVSWVSGIDYAFADERAVAFYAAIRRYYPGLRDGSLLPGYTGIRPKLLGEGSPAQDFVIQGPNEHGVPGLVNLFGIESPGLTAALPLAARVRALLPG